MARHDPPEADSPPSAGASKVPGCLLVVSGAVGVIVTHLIVGGLLYVAVLALAMVSPPSANRMANGFIGWFLGLPLLQLLYVVPAGIVAWRARRPLALGIALGALITFLLYSVCYGSLFVLWLGLGNVPF